MAVRYAFICFFLSLMLTTVICQTFQYSHGWTNGKRSFALEDLMNSPSKNSLQLDNVLVDCEPQKLRLLPQGNINSQEIQLSCKVFSFTKRSFAESMDDIDHFRRKPASMNNY
ncbi:corazonin [Nomia melanderi]|uniref:corazonin n=1 Tax=Nomia melanderi TaxID=2448451 RepID=UPI003FCCBE3E